MKQFRRLYAGALFALFFLVCLDATAAKPIRSTEPPPSPEVSRFAAEVAKAGNLDESEILATLAKARVQQSILDAIARPAEGKPWKDYRPIFVNSSRIDGGVDFYRANRALLERVGKEYGVPPELVVAIIGVETNYGRITGRYRVLDALYTLAFAYPPRAEFFRGELRQLFLLGDKHLAFPIDELKGSYAGAMGWGQFMPSSIDKYAVDFDRDGQIDLWDSLSDITASIANYFVGYGWEKDGPVMLRAVAASDAKPLRPENLESVYTVQQLEAWGYAPTGHVDAARKATLLTLDGENGPEYWLTFNNFFVISRYNHSSLYSTAVWQVAQAVAAGSAASAP